MTPSQIQLIREAANELYKHSYIVDDDGQDEVNDDEVIDLVKALRQLADDMEKEKSVKSIQDYPRSQPAKEEKDYKCPHCGVECFQKFACHNCHKGLKPQQIEKLPLVVTQNELIDHTNLINKINELVDVINSLKEGHG